IHLDRDSLEHHEFDIKENDFKDITQNNVASYRFAAYQLVGNQIRKLPTGSTFDMERGVFYWHPGPGFIGKYRFVFITGMAKGDSIKREVTVTIVPK
ncbi:MAG: hypothetical protein GY757_61410, partial [bacterium]|nr:hypothetical protein [bacterium]